MSRLTTNKPIEEMSMLELAYNSCYIGECGEARYRDFEIDINARKLLRNIYEVQTGIDAAKDDDEFDNDMMEALAHDPEDTFGLLALFYRNLWAMAELRERLKYYEDLADDGKFPEFPCGVGDVVYTNMRVSGWYFKEKDKPYKAEVVFIGVNGTDNFVNVVFENGNMLQFKFSDLGETWFLTKEEAEKALEEMREKV